MRTSHWKRLTVGLMALTVLLISACGGKPAAPTAAEPSAPAAGTAAPAGNTAPASEPATTAAPVKITFVADYPPPAWVAQIPWVVAEARGFYKDAGLDVTIEFPPTPDAPPKLIATGKAQLTVSYTPDLLTATAEGLNVLAVASLLDQNNGGLMAWADVAQTPKQLEGKTIALYDFPMGKMHWRTFVKHHGLDESKIRVVNAGDYSVPLMVSNQAQGGDAAAASEYVVAQHEAGRKATFWLYDESNGIPNHYWFVIAANPQFAKEQPVAVKAFVKATLDGLKYAQEHPDEAVDLFVQKYPDLDKEMQKAAWKELELSFKRFYPDKPAGWMELAPWEGYMNFMVENGLLSQKVDLGHLFTNDFVPQP